MVSKTRLVVTLQRPTDTSSRNRDKNWQKVVSNQAVEQGETRLRYKDIVGTPCDDRMGLGNNKQSKRKTRATRTYAIVQQEIRDMEEESRKTKAVQMGKQGSWTMWTTLERSLSWADIWQYEPLRLKFLLGSVYDVLRPTSKSLPMEPNRQPKLQTLWKK